MRTLTAHQLSELNSASLFLDDDEYEFTCPASERVWMAAPPACSKSLFCGMLIIVVYTLRKPRAYRCFAYPSAQNLKNHAMAWVAQSVKRWNHTLNPLL